MPQVRMFKRRDRVANSSGQPFIDPSLGGREFDALGDFGQALTAKANELQQQRVNMLAKEKQIFDSLQKKEALVDFDNEVMALDRSVAQSNPIADDGTANFYPQVFGRALAEKGDEILQRFNDPFVRQETFIEMQGKINSFRNRASVDRMKKIIDTKKRVIEDDLSTEKKALARGDLNGDEIFAAKQRGTEIIEEGIRSGVYSESEGGARIQNFQNNFGGILAKEVESRLDGMTTKEVVRGDADKLYANGLAGLQSGAFDIKGEDVITTSDRFTKAYRAAYARAQKALDDAAEERENDGILKLDQKMAHDKEQNAGRAEHEKTVSVLQEDIDLLVAQGILRDPEKTRILRDRAQANIDGIFDDRKEFFDAQSNDKKEELLEKLYNGDDPLKVEQEKKSSSLILNKKDSAAVAKEIASIRAGDQSDKDKEKAEFVRLNKQRFNQRVRAFIVGQPALSKGIGTKNEELLIDDFRAIGHPRIEAGEDYVTVFNDIVKRYKEVPDAEFNTKKKILTTPEEIINDIAGTIAIGEKLTPQQQGEYIQLKQSNPRAFVRPEISQSKAQGQVEGGFAIEGILDSAIQPQAITPPQTIPPAQTSLTQGKQGNLGRPQAPSPQPAQAQPPVSAQPTVERVIPTNPQDPDVFEQDVETATDALSLGERANVDNARPLEPGDKIEEVGRQIFFDSKKTKASALPSIKKMSDIKIKDYSNKDFVKAEIVRISKEMKLNPKMVLAVAFIESSYNQNAKSKAGAHGIMQITPITAKEIASKSPLGLTEKEILEDGEANIKAGAWYLDALYKRFSETKNPMALALAAYNFGPTAVRKMLNKSDEGKFAVDLYKKLPKETKDYILKFLAEYERLD